MRSPLALIEDVSLDEERVIALHGEVDVSVTPLLRDWLSRASEGARRSLAVDLDHVTFLSVDGVHALCEEQQRMVGHRARLTVVCAKRPLLQLFDICRVSDILVVVPSRDDVRSSVWTLGDDLRARRLARWLA